MSILRHLIVTATSHLNHSPLLSFGLKFGPLLPTLTLKMESHHPCWQSKNEENEVDCQTDILFTDTQTGAETQSDKRRPSSLRIM